MSRSRSRLPAVPLVVAALVAATIAPAAADPIHVEDQLDRSALQQAERDSRAIENVRARLQQRLDQIEQEVSGAVEAYNVAVEELEHVEAQRHEVAAELTALTAERDTLSRLAGAHVRRLHKLGGPGLELATLLASGNPTDAGARSAALRRVLDAQLIDLEALGAARTAVSAAEERLAVLEAQAAERAAQVEAALEALQDKLAEHQDEMADIEVRLRAARHRVAQEEELLEEQRQELLAREQARRAEEERARQEADERARQQAGAEAEARRRAQADADARERSQAQPQSQPTATTTSTTSTQGAPAPAPAPTTRSSASVAVSTALAQVGKPYQWGANGPNSFDCSGLTSFAWRAAGVTIPRSSGAQYAGLTKVTRAQLQPGDLVFYYSPISHVAMYIGGGQIVEAPYTGTTVRVRSMDSSTPVGYARP